MPTDFDVNSISVVTDLYEVPSFMEAALDLLTVKELGIPTFHVIHQAASIRKEDRGPESPQMKKSFFGVAGKLEERKGQECRGNCFGIRYK